MKQVSFSNLPSDRIKSLFLPTYAQYNFPAEVKIILEGTHLKGSTMQAQPVMSFPASFSGIDTYRIRLAEYVRDSQELKVAELPDDILIGWFAHELGHVWDYLDRSLPEMAGFGLRYLVSRKFRRKVEHRADEIAITQGFHDYILKTKEFLFNHDLIDEKYRNKMKRYYMSMEDAQAFIEANVPIDPID